MAYGLTGKKLQKSAKMAAELVGPIPKGAAVRSKFT
jgi:hypothetical protein